MFWKLIWPRDGPGPGLSCDPIRRTWTILQRVVGETVPEPGARGLNPKSAFLVRRALEGSPVKSTEFVR